MRQMLDADERPSDSKKMGVIFITLFIFARVIICPFLTYWFCRSNEHIILKVGCCLLTWIGYIWSWRIANMASKQLAEVFMYNISRLPKINSIKPSIPESRAYESTLQYGP